MKIGPKRTRSVPRRRGPKENPVPVGEKPVHPRPLVRGLGLRRVLVPVDFSRESAAQLAYARTFANRSGGSVILLHVTPTVRVALDCGYGPVNREVPDDEQIRRDSARLRRFAARHIPARMLGGVLIRAGTPSEEIARAASEERAEMIVLCAYRAGRANSLRDHETVERVIRQVLCPVFVVSPPERKGSRASNRTVAGTKARLPKRKVAELVS